MFFRSKFKRTDYHYKNVLSVYTESGRLRLPSYKAFVYPLTFCGVTSFVYMFLELLFFFTALIAFLLRATLTVAIIVSVFLAFVSNEFLATSFSQIVNFTGKQLVFYLLSTRVASICDVVL